MERGGNGWNGEEGGVVGARGGRWVWLERRGGVVGTQGGVIRARGEGVVGARGWGWGGWVGARVGWGARERRGRQEGGLQQHVLRDE